MWCNRVKLLSFSEQLIQPYLKGMRGTGTGLLEVRDFLRVKLDDLWPGLDLSFAGSQGEYHCMWRCPRPGLNPSGLVNNSSLAAGPQFTEVKIL